ncbi:non-specific lipid transfer protein-like 1 isoform X1 [Hordeum vulgare subsp. vulgare]|uniref:Predicted protein n=1 Tax=Hordeum vulgare subsp. vulgare TaxID=112509 RepID=F2CTP1_HORVV|nr:non-specific lipid transfer protein-like 1 isoform X1 [Hordeum vulgare subsp. vulgare]BAJ86212.1 predicted protein [Hordeum vulgare subsp. vulgare]
MALAGGATTAACLLVLLAIAHAAGAASHHAPAAAPAPDCTEALIGLADCLDYVLPGSKSAKPSKTCCGEVKTAVGTPATVKCLCEAMAAKETPIPINMTRVLALPGACGEPASVLNKCHALPGGAPAEAPAPSPSSGSAAASPPKANASARSPATILVATVAASLLAFYYL